MYMLKVWSNEFGQYHRLDGPAVMDGDGNDSWYLNDQLHREDGPAVLYANGSKFWYQHGLRHREDGPATEWANGRKRWFLNDKEYTEEEYVMIQFMNGKNIYV